MLQSLNHFVYVLTKINFSPPIQLLIIKSPDSQLVLMLAPYHVCQLSSHDSQSPSETTIIIKKWLPMISDSTAASALLHCYAKLQTCRDQAQKPDLFSL